MSKFSTVICNWLERLRLYGFRNTLKLHKYLRKPQEFALAINGSNFNIRGNTVDFVVFHSIFGKKEYDLNIPFEPEVIIDAGANIGASTLFLKMNFPNAKIIAIEPEKSNFTLLKKNLLDFPEVSLEEAALWSNTEFLYIKNNSEEKYAFQVTDISEESANKVSGLTIQDILNKYDIDGIDILKIDIEGAEKQIFAENCSSWLAITKLMIIELHDTISPGTSKVFFNAINEIDYDLRVKGENVYVINRKLI